MEEILVKLLPLALVIIPFGILSAIFVGIQRVFKRPGSSGQAIDDGNGAGK